MNDGRTSLVEALDAINQRVNRGVGEGSIAPARWRDALIEVGGMLDDLINSDVGEFQSAWDDAVAALSEGLDERSLSVWWDNRKPSGWWAAASHRFDPTRPVPTVVKGFDSKEAALRGLIAALNRRQDDPR